MSLTIQRTGSASSRLASASLKAVKILLLLLGLLGVTNVVAGVVQDGEPTSRPAPPEPELAIAAPISQTDWEVLRKMHGSYLHQFKIAPGFGKRRLVEMPYSETITLAGNSFVVSKPELIALETKPIVYANGWELISMADLTNHTTRLKFQTREMTAPESNAIAELRDGRDIVFIAASVPINTAKSAPELEGYRVIGALRADTGCARCHECAVGTLLGAFSYRIISSEKWREYRLQSVLSPRHPGPAAATQPTVNFFRLSPLQVLTPQPRLKATLNSPPPKLDAALDSHPRFSNVSLVP